MTERPIDVSTLRDGDLIRVEWDYQGSATGIARRTLSGEWLLEVGTVWSLSIKTATITDILRPVLVKGDRVEWDHVATGQHQTGTVSTVGEGGHLLIARDGGGAAALHVDNPTLRRLPAAPEPAPIEVGDWWQQPENGTAWVVVERDESALAIPCGHVLIGLRRIDQNPDAIVRYREGELRSGWTRLDGPPEPPVGKVYTIAGDLWAHTFVDGGERWHVRAGSNTWFDWREVKGCYLPDVLATLQIVHTLGVE